MLLEILYCLIVAIILAIACLITYARWNYGKLNNLGFPVIPPSFILGSGPDLHKYIQHYEDIKRFKKYGPVWGYFQGRTPIVYIADAELIKEIWVKDNEHFYNRKPLEFGNSILNEILDFLPDEKWKTMRVSQTKLFSSSKIKQYTNNVFLDAINDFMTKMNEDMKIGKTDRLEIDARERFCTYTVDALGRSMYSMPVDSDKDQVFYNACKKLIGDGQEVSPFYVWTLTFPFLAKFEPTLILDEEMPKRFHQIVQSRLSQSDNNIFGDYGDILTQCFQKISSIEYKRLKITKNTLLGQAVNLFLAGFDRISSHMSFLVYHLAKEPTIQEKIYNEIYSIIELKHNGHFDYNSMQELEYLHACILEVSRLYPVLVRPERVCSKDWISSKFGIRIPKGVPVMIASWAVNRNPKYYTDPDEFKPERFLGDSKSTLNSYAYTSFGFGHRNCIGMRFAYEAIRTSMAKLIYNYKFELKENSKIDFKRGINFIIQFEPIYLDIVKRN